MIDINLNLLQSDELPEDVLETSGKNIGVRGSYNPMQFVLRLRGDIHRILKDTTPGIYIPGTVSGEIPAPSNPDGDIHPALFPGYDEKQIENTFNDFFVWNTLYDMVRKWIIEAGPFTYNYRWLSSKHSAKQIKTWATNIFSNSFGHSPDDFKIL